MRRRSTAWPARSRGRRSRARRARWPRRQRDVRRDGDGHHRRGSTVDGQREPTEAERAPADNQLPIAVNVNAPPSDDGGGGGALSWFVVVRLARGPRGSARGQRAGGAGCSCRRRLRLRLISRAERRDDPYADRSADRGGRACGRSSRRADPGGGRRGRLARRAGRPRRRGRAFRRDSTRDPAGGRRDRHAGRADSRTSPRRSSRCSMRSPRASARSPYCAHTCVAHASNPKLSHTALRFIVGLRSQEKWVVAANNGPRSRRLTAHNGLSQDLCNDGRQDQRSRGAIEPAGAFRALRTGSRSRSSGRSCGGRRRARAVEAGDDAAHRSRAQHHRPQPLARYSVQPVDQSVSRLRARLHLLLCARDAFVSRSFAGPRLRNGNLLQAERRGASARRARGARATK